MDAQRAILVQNLGLTWRYSIGNAYEQFSFPEGVDVAQVMSSYGHEDVARSILRTSLTRQDAPLSELEDGPEARRLGAPLPPLPRRGLRRRGDARAPRLRRRARPAARGERARDPRSGSASRPTSPTRSTASTRRRSPGRGCAGWGSSGPRRAMRRSRRSAAFSPTRLGRGLRAAVRESQVRLPDGSLFLPVPAARPGKAVRRSDRVPGRQLLEPRHPLRARIRPLRPGQHRGEGCPALHAPARLALARARPRRCLRALRTRPRRIPTSGTDQVYGLNVARFLAAQRRAGRARAQPLRPARGRR